MTRCEGREDNGSLVALNSMYTAVNEMHSSVKMSRCCAVTNKDFSLVQVGSSDRPFLLPDPFDDGFFGGLFRQRLRLDMETSRYDSNYFELLTCRYWQNEPIWLVFFWGSFGCFLCGKVAIFVFLSWSWLSHRYFSSHLLLISNFYHGQLLVIAISSVTNAAGLFTLNRIRLSWQPSHFHSYHP